MKTKKILSLLLVIAMIFSLAIPAFAEEAKTAAKADAVAAGDQVVIYNADAGKVMSAEGYTYNGKTVKDELKSLDASVENGTMTVPEGAAVLTAAVNEAGQYSFVTADGKYLYADGTNVRLVSEQGENTLFVLETADGGFFIKCANAQYNGKAQYLEYYSNYFTVYGMNTNTAIYTFQFFKVEKEDVIVNKDLEGKTVILHSNDVHGAIAGYANMAALKAEYAAKGADVILVDAGDFSQGTTYVSTTKGADAIAMMNAVGYDFATLGNHEFDYGWPQLKENMEKADFKVLCADVLENGETIFDASAIVEKDGVKIGFFGMETPEAQTKANPALIKGLTFLAGDEMYAAAQAQIDALKAAGADVIICLSHLGLDAESEPNRSVDMLAKVEGLDMIIDGHSHTVITATAEQPIQSTGTAFANIGVVVIDNATKAIVDNYLVPVTEESAADETVAAAAQEIIGKIDELYGEVFAKSEVELNGDKAPNGNRDSETNLGDLICDSMVWSVLKDEGSITVPAENVVAITNGGGIRAWIHKGDITMNDVHTVLPFGNTVAVVYVTGAELLEALEASTYCTPTSVGGFPQVAGIDFTIYTVMEYDAQAETYPASTYYGPASIQRVVINSINGKAFDAEATYAVVTNNFCAAGGDTYYAFAAASAQFDTGVPLDEALMAYITEELKGVVGEQYAEPQGRITLCEDPYYDIATSGYHDGIVDAAGYQIVKGYEDGTFRPNESVTRAQFITMLYRAAGEPEVTNTALKFADAGMISAPYQKAVAWGVENGIINGYEDNTFRPNQTISRAQMATFMARYIVSEFGPTDAATEASFGFVDEASFAAAYADSINIIANLGIMNGVDKAPTFNPNGTATRGMAATVLARLCAWRWSQIVDTTTTAA